MLIRFSKFDAPRFVYNPQYRSDTNAIHLLYLDCTKVSGHGFPVAVMPNWSILALALITGLLEFPPVMSDSYESGIKFSVFIGITSQSFEWQPSSRVQSNSGHFHVFFLTNHRWKNGNRKSLRLWGVTNSSVGDSHYRVHPGKHGSLSILTREPPCKACVKHLFLLLSFK